MRNRREPELVRDLEGWRDWGPEEIREDLDRRTLAREIDMRHQWERRHDGPSEREEAGPSYTGRAGRPPHEPGEYRRGGWREGRRWSRGWEGWQDRPPYHQTPPWEREARGTGGFGGYGGGPYGGSYGGFGPGEADEYPPSGVRGGITGAGSAAGGYGLAQGWREDRMRMREGARRRRPWPSEGPLVRDLMTLDPKVVSPDASVRDAARVMRAEDAGIVPVCHEGRILGVITDRDLTVRVLANGRDPTAVQVSEVMSGDVQVVTPDDLLVDAVRIMGEEHVRRLPVVDRDDRIVGILSMTDVAREAEIDYALQEALDQIASRRSFWSRW